jgi:hypothetical protein
MKSDSSGPKLILEGMKEARHFVQSINSVWSTTSRKRLRNNKVYK